MTIRKLSELQDCLPRYDYTAELGRDRWAWEFYRRDPELRDVAHFYQAREEVSVRKLPGVDVKTLKLRRAQPEAEARGLAFFPNPDRNALSADLFWSDVQWPRNICVQVVPVESGSVDEFLTMALERCKITHLTGYEGREQFILRGSGSSVQIRAEGISLFSQKPHKMRVVIDGGEDFDEKMAVLKRAQRVYGKGDDNPSSWSGRSMDLRNALICLDAKEAGLSYWEMAELIHGRDHVQSTQERGSRALKDAMRRHLKRGEDLRDGGYEKLLVPKSAQL